MAAIVIRLFYEEERQKAKARELYGKKHDPMTNWSGGSEEGTTRKLLAKKAGVGEGSIQRLLAVYRNRPDLFERVFNGEYSINRAYTEMKADEQPEEVEYVTNL